MNENLKGLIEEMLDIYGDFEDMRYRNGNFTRETIRYITEMERIHCQKFPSHVNWESRFEYTRDKINLLLYEAERDIAIAILLKIKEQV